MTILRIDLHVHTNRSDGILEPIAMIKFARKKGLDGIAITDHDVPMCEDEYIDLSERAGDFIVIPGVEVSTRQGHILLLGVHESPPKKCDVFEALKIARKNGGIIIIPHPFDYIRKGLGSLAKKIPADGIEIYNGGTLFNFMNKKAFKLAKERQLPMISSSDAHIPSALGHAYTIFRLANDDYRYDYRKILHLISQNKIIPFYRKINQLEKIREKIVRKILWNFIQAGI